MMPKTFWEWFSALGVLIGAVLMSVGAYWVVLWALEAKGYDAGAADTIAKVVALIGFPINLATELRRRYLHGWELS